MIKPKHTNTEILHEAIRLAMVIFDVDSFDDLARAPSKTPEVRQCNAALCYVLRLSTSLTQKEVATHFCRLHKSWVHANAIRARELRQSDATFAAATRNLHDRLETFIGRTIRPDAPRPAAPDDSRYSFLAASTGEPAEVHRMRQMVSDGDARFRRRLEEMAREQRMGVPA